MQRLTQFIYEEVQKIQIVEEEVKEDPKLVKKVESRKKEQNTNFVDLHDVPGKYQ